MVKIVVRNLHWLLVQSGITCKILLLVFKALKDMRRTKIPHYIEDITRWREDMNFMFEWQEQDIVLATKT